MAAHLVGDFLLQNHWMQRKVVDSWVCSVHVACYSLPFLWLVQRGELPWWALAIILLEHWLQDRFSLHLRWMRTYGQTSPEKWPVGPLCVDQAMHISFIWILSYFF